MITVLEPSEMDELFEAEGRLSNEASAIVVRFLNDRLFGDVLEVRRAAVLAELDRISDELRDVWQRMDGGVAR